MQSTARHRPGTVALIGLLSLAVGCASSDQKPAVNPYFTEDDLPGASRTEVEAPAVDWDQFIRLARGSDEEMKLTQQFGQPSRVDDMDSAGTVYGTTTHWTNGGITVKHNAAGLVYSIDIGRRWSAAVQGARVGDRLSVLRKNAPLVLEGTVETPGERPISYDLDWARRWYVLTKTDFTPSGLLNERGVDQGKKPHPEDPVIFKIWYYNSDREPKLRIVPRN